MWFKSLVIMLFLLTSTLPTSAQTNIASLKVDTTPTKSVQELVSNSNLIVQGWADSSHEEYPTGQQVGQYQKVNFVQKLHVKKTFKGTSSTIVNILTTGIEPLPDASSPLNKAYPGPLAEGDYVCFLKNVPGTELYTIVGSWQGVYPVFQDKTISLQGEGYPELNQLTMKQLEQKIKSLNR